MRDLTPLTAWLARLEKLRELVTAWEEHANADPLALEARRDLLAQMGVCVLGLTGAYERHGAAMAKVREERART